MSTILTGWDTSTNLDVFKTLVKKTFDSTDREAIVEANRLYNMEKTSDLYERTMRFAGMERGVEIAEGGEIPILAPKFGQTKDYTVAEYGLGFRVSWLFGKTNKWDLVRKFTKNMKMNQRELKEAELAKLWNSPTATYVGYGGTLHLAENSHTCLDDDASTYDNYGAVAFSVTGMESAKYYFDTLKDDQGNRFFAKPDTLYHCPYLETQVWEVLNSSGKPHELSNTENRYEGMIKAFNYHYLTGTTSWGVVAKNHPKYDVNCFTLSEPDVEVKDAPNNSRDKIVTSLQAFSFGFGDPRMCWVGF